MKFEVKSEYRELIVNVNLSELDFTVTSSRGYTFTPETLHALWVRENADAWGLVYTELRGKLKGSGRPVNKTYWGDESDLPGWVTEVVADTTPVEVLTERVS